MSGWKPIKISHSVTEPSEGADESLPPIIFLHGMLLSKEDWEGVDKTLADATHRKVYKLDARNHGESDRTDDFDFGILGEDVNYFMVEQGIEKAFIVGHSMGGRTAMVLAGKHPDKVEKMIIEDMLPQKLEGPVIEFTSGFLGLYMKSLEAIPPTADLESAKKIASDVLWSSVPPEMATEQTRAVFDIAHSLEKTESGFRWKSNIEVIKNNFFDMMEAFEGTYDGDSLFIFGSKSPYTSQHDKEITLKSFPKAVFKEIEGATHLVHKEYPEEFVKIIVDFIK